MPSISAFQSLTAQAVANALCTKVLGRSLHILDETSSTNTAAFALAQEGAPDGTVVVAETQTMGKGRLGRQWYSPSGKNLYCSILLRRAPAPDHMSHWLSWVPLLSAVAVSRAVQVVSGLRTALKWPNDILIEQRKIGGLLCESSGTGTANGFVIVGIGLNINMWRTDFPNELQDIATSVAAEAGRLFDRAAVLAMLLSELELRYDAYFSNGFSDIQCEYSIRCSTLAQRVRVTLANHESVEGMADSIAADGALQIIPDHPLEPSKRGAVMTIRAGDVVHLRKENFKF